MAVNKVVYGNSTLMDVTDTTATSDEVLEGEIFYSASGTRSTGTLGDATQSTHGLMSATDKTKLDGIAAGATAVTVENILTSTSTINALSAAQGKALNDAIDDNSQAIAYIVGDTNTTGLTLKIGQFVYVKSHSTIPDGIRRVTAQISNNGAITTNNTANCPEGGLNTLNNDIAAINNLYSNQVAVKSLKSGSTGIRFNFAAQVGFTMLVTSQNFCAHISKLPWKAAEIHLLYGQFVNTYLSSEAVILNTGGDMRILAIYTVLDPASITIESY